MRSVPSQLSPSMACSSVSGGCIIQLVKNYVKEGCLVTDTLQKLAVATSVLAVQAFLG